MLKRKPEISPAESTQSLDAWIQAYGTDVFNLAFSYVHHYHQAQDIAQEVFLKAYTKQDSFRGQSSVKTWLLSITANRCKDYLRSWSVKHVVQDEDPILQATTPVNTEREVVDKLEGDALWQVVAALPVKYREVIALFYQRDLSIQEISEVLGVSEANVRTRLHRGRGLLKEMLDRGDATYGVE